MSRGKNEALSGSQRTKGDERSVECKEDDGTRVVESLTRPNFTDKFRLSTWRMGTRGPESRARRGRGKITWQSWIEGKRCVILHPDASLGVENNRRSAPVTLRFPPARGIRFEIPFLYALPDPLRNDFVKLQRRFLGEKS